MTLEVRRRFADFSEADGDESGGCEFEDLDIEGGFGSRVIVVQMKFAVRIHMRGDGVFEFVDAFSCGAGDDEEGQLAAADMGLQFFQLLRIGGIGLGGDDEHGLVTESVAEAGEFFIDGLEGFDGIFCAAVIGNIHQMHEDAGAFDVAEELNAESGTEMRAFDEAGHICDDEALFFRPLADGGDAEIRLKSGEGIVGNFWTSCRESRNERGFAGVGKTNETDIGEQLEFEAEKTFFSGATEFVFARGLMGGSGEVLIAATTASAACNNDAIVGSVEIVD